jgi:hypothetical protein
MATHDYIISNASGAAVRADLNNALAAIATNNSSATEPTTTYAYQWWADTGSSPTVMKLRNAANSAWITLFQLDGEWTVVPFENGTAAAPSIYFKDSGTDTGIYSPGTDSVAITTGGTQRATVDSSGRLLVKTSSSRSWSGVSSQFQIENAGSGTFASQSIIANTADIFGGFLTLGKSRGTSLGSNTLVQAGDILGKIHFYGADGSALVQSASIAVEVDSTPGANDMPGRITLSTTADAASSPTERMRIDSKGSLSLWTPGNTTAAPQDVDARIFAFSDTSNSVLYIDSRRAGEFIHINQSYADSVNRGAVAFYRNESQIGSISISSAQVFYNTTSDYRLKENVVDLENATALVKQLKPRSFNFISEPDTAINGFIAHEVQAVAPEAVTGEKDAIDDEGNPKYQGIDQSKLVPLLTAALQEALTRIEQLEAAVTALQQS